MNIQKNSRCENFLDHPLLCIKQTNQSSWVHYDSLNVTKFVIYSVRCYYYAYIYKSTIDNSSKYFLSDYRLDKPSHLAIYSNENWRQRHKPLDYDASLNFDLSWLKDKKKSKHLYNFIEGIYLKGNYDDFQKSFLNALILFNEALFQTNSISTLLNMTIGESLLTRGKNEKRLRLSALLPRLLLISKNEQKLLSKKLSDLYSKRNDFVHDGKSITIKYEYEKEKLSILDEAKKYNAQLILQFTKFEKIIDGISDKPNFSRMKKWDEYVNSIFQELIF